jgi:predicted amidohydrolase YtcJ
MMASSTIRRACTCLTLAAAAACGGGDRADLVLTNGKVVTVDPAQPEAEALAVRDGLVLAVGSSAEMEAYVGPGTRVVDLDGRLAIPGFIEGHGHYTSLGRARMILDLTGVANWDEIVDMVGEAAASAEPGAWIAGRGWHQEKWDQVPAGAVEGVPVHTALSAVSPDNPVILGHASGHAAYANARAMELANIGPDTPDPDGGTIVRDAEGRATGLLRENADALVFGVMEAAMASRSSEEQEAEFVRVVELAGEDALSKGVTTFHDAGSDFETIDGFRTLADEGRLPVRLYGRWDPTAPGSSSLTRTCRAAWG